jgi:hypothetical protein
MSDQPERPRRAALAATAGKEDPTSHPDLVNDAANSSGSEGILEIREIPASTTEAPVSATTRRPRPPKRSAAEAADKAIHTQNNPELGSDEEAINTTGSEADEQPVEADPLIMLAEAAQGRAQAQNRKV